LKHLNKTINGDNTIAIQRTHILIINTKAAAIKGIHIANVCNNANKELKNAE